MLNVVSGDAIFTNEIGARLTTAPETRPGALIGVKYAIAPINNGKTVGHVPKFLPKLTFFFLKNGGKLQITVLTGPQACNLIKKETLAQVFSCKFGEISKNIFSTEHLQRTATAFLISALPVLNRHTFLSNISITDFLSLLKEMSNTIILLYYSSLL